MTKQPKPKHWRTREQFVEAERKIREAKKRDAERWPTYDECMRQREEDTRGAGR